MKRHIPALVTLIATTVGACDSAWAMTLSYTTTVDDSRIVTHGTGTVMHERNPGSDGFTHTFTEPTTFYDDFIFDVTAGTVSSIVTTLTSATSQISNLQERIYIVDAGETENDVPTLGTPSGTVLQAWTNLTPGGTLLTLTDGMLSGGRYSLQIRGNVIGATGGTYSGSINFSPAPVPLPAALPLLLCGFGFTIVLGRRTPRFAPANKS